MQKELEQKRKEYLLEAENVVRIREEAFNQELLKLQTELDHQKRIQVCTLLCTSILLGEEFLCKNAILAKIGLSNFIHRAIHK